MKNFLLTLVVAVVGVVLSLPDAEAGRVGGGRSIGAQRNVTAPPAQAPAQSGVTKSTAAPAAAAAQPASGLSRWMPLLGGLAIGGLLGSMFGGFGGGLGGILLIALLAVAGVVVVRMLARSRMARPMQYAGTPGQAGYPAFGAPQSLSTPASAEPSPTPGVEGSIPAGFDVAGFVRAAKYNYIRMQDANDRGDAATIREMTTAAMFDVLAADMSARAGVVQRTDVATLEADLLEVATEGDLHRASLRFRGLIRETTGAEPAPFEEIWNLEKPVSGTSGWLLAGIQQIS